MKKIEILGIPGSGKSTISEIVSEKSGIKLIRERFEDNPFLPLLYKDLEKSFEKRSKYCLLNQMCFLFDYSRQFSQSMLDCDYILDAGPTMGPFYVRAQYESGIIDEVELGTYFSLYASMEKHIKHKEGVQTIVLLCDPELAYKRVIERDREMEVSVGSSFGRFLTTLNDKMLSGLPSDPIIVDANHNDMGRKVEDILNLIV